MGVTLLDTDLLERFEDSLRSVGAAITETWAPGLTDEEIDRAVRKAGLRLPEEARRWWRWHNGTVPGTRPPRWDLLPSRPLLDLDTVVDQLLDDIDPSSHLLQPLPDQPWIFFDCRVEPDQPVPIVVSGHGQDDRVVLPSIGELVTIWVDLIETGAFATNPDGTWQWEFDRIPAEIRELGVY
jgi:hypothetical protein